MSMLNHTSSTTITAGSIFSTIKSVLARAINSTIARLLAQREYEANLRILRSLSDRELMDMGINRTQIGGGLQYAGKERLAMQEVRARLSLMS
jgi:uncharacterized protein YjiS (DUF1127 family)